MKQKNKSKMLKSLFAFTIMSLMLVLAVAVTYAKDGADDSSESGGSGKNKVINDTTVKVSGELETELETEHGVVYTKIKYPNGTIVFEDSNGLLIPDPSSGIETEVENEQGINFTKIKYPNGSVIFFDKDGKIVTELSKGIETEVENERGVNFTKIKYPNGTVLFFDKNGKIVPELSRGIETEIETENEINFTKIKYPNGTILYFAPNGSIVLNFKESRQQNRGNQDVEKEVERIKKEAEKKRQEFEKELNKSNEKAKETLKKQNRVRESIHILLELRSEFDKKGLGENISQIAREFNNSVDKTIEAELKIDDRSGVRRFFAGGDSDSAKKIESEIEDYTQRINDLDKLKKNAEPEYQALIDDATKKITEERDRLQKLATEEQNSKGLFGWMWK